ncbi:MAG: hypothetical protein K0S25_184 [Bacillus sp. (in: firmicutes)]|nr:hypothetical protein [Bacillus sp. (in: firmicutes)]
MQVVAWKGVKVLIKLLTKRRFLILLVVMIAASIAYIVLPISLPLIISFITALLLEPFVKKLQYKLKIKRRVSVLIVFIFFILLLSLCSYFITTKVIAEVIKIVENSPFFINEMSKKWVNIEAYLMTLSKDLPPVVIKQISFQVQQFLDNFKDSLLSYVNINNLKAILTNIPNYLVSFIVFLVALFLFLLDLPKINENLYQHLSEKTTTKVTIMSSRLSYVVFGFLKAQFLISVIISILSLIALLIITPEIAIVMSLLIWLIDFIPIFGAITVLAPWALFQLLTGGIILGIELVILICILLVIKKMIKPKLMGTQVGLSPLSTLVTMYLGFKILGFIGIIVGPFLLITFNAAREAGMIKMNFKI